MSDCKSDSGPPEFKKSLRDLSVPVGTGARFLVEISKSNSDIIRVSWFHNDDQVTNSDRIVLLQDNLIFCLQIPQTTPTDVGKWVCQAENGSGKISCSALLKIQIPEIYRAPEFVTGLRGCLWDNGTLSLETDVLGVPTPVLRWFRDGKPLSSGSALTIRAFSKESKSLLGVFACEAENCMGSKSTFSRVYARNFANYLKQCGHSPKPVTWNSSKKNTPKKQPKSNGTLPKTSIAASDNKKVNNQIEHDEDSEIA